MKIEIENGSLRIRGNRGVYLIVHFKEFQDYDRYSFGLRIMLTMPDIVWLIVWVSLSTCLINFAFK